MGFTEAEFRHHVGNELKACKAANARAEALLRESLRVLEDHQRPYADSVCVDCQQGDCDESCGYAAHLAALREALGVR